MKNEQPYRILAFYYFCEIENPHEEVSLHKNFFKNRDMTSRIYISEEGINGQMSAAKKDADEYITWMHGRAPFNDIHFKVDCYHEHVFPRQCIKYRNQLVAMDDRVDLAQKGDYLSPEEWKERLGQEDKPLLIDVRNDYEWEVGHFDGAELPNCSTFREFNAYADKLKEKHTPKKTPVMMYCTGGIRCELYSAALKKRGFEKVYQLQGGVINYGHEVGNDHWQGKLFVFDDRMTTTISDQQHTTIGKCFHCGEKVDDFYNCANVDCNKLHLCCEECLVEFAGCCSKECIEAPRVRFFEEQNPHKPFRRLSQLSAQL